METFSALLAICAGNSPVPGEFPAQRPVTRSFDVFFDVRLNKRLSKQSCGWWFETLACPLWRHSNGTVLNCIVPNWCHCKSNLMALRPRQSVISLIRFRQSLGNGLVIINLNPIWPYSGMHIFTNPCDIHPLTEKRHLVFRELIGPGDSTQSLDKQISS